MFGSSTFCNTASFSRNSWYILRMAPNCDWQRFNSSVRVLLVRVQPAQRWHAQTTALSGGPNE
ncbi:hypothetical protein T01_13841, partial [Trichinella spiralis]